MINSLLEEIEEHVGHVDPLRVVDADIRRVRQGQDLAENVHRLRRGHRRWDQGFVDDVIRRCGRGRSRIVAALVRLATKRNARGVNGERTGLPGSRRCTHLQTNKLQYPVGEPRSCNVRSSATITGFMPSPSTLQDDGVT